MLDKGVGYDLGEGHLFLNHFLVEISKIKKIGMTLAQKEDGGL